MSLNIENFSIRHYCRCVCSSLYSAVYRSLCPLTQIDAITLVLCTLSLYTDWTLTADQWLKADSSPLCCHWGVGEVNCWVRVQRLNVFSIWRRGDDNMTCHILAKATCFTNLKEKHSVSYPNEDFSSSSVLIVAHFTGMVLVHFLYPKIHISWVSNPTVTKSVIQPKILLSWMKGLWFDFFWKERLYQ